MSAQEQDLIDALWHIAVLVALVNALKEVAAEDGADADAVRVSSVERYPVPVRQAVERWARERQCALAEVPLVAALEAAMAEQAVRVRRSFFRMKQSPLVVDNAPMTDLLTRLGDAYESREALADYLELELMTLLPEAIKRAARVRPLMIHQRMPPALVARYKEAVRSYVFRNPLACCALCRAIIEAALKEAVETRFGTNPDGLKFVELVQALQRARILPDDEARMCIELRERGDTALHGEIALQSDAAQASLDATQRVLRTLFSHE
jgi:uncharacterized protein DUF4145